MQLAKSGQIGNVCGPNAIMTLKEYLEDYASEDTAKKGEVLIAKEVEKIENEKVKELVRAHLDELHEGARDFRF